MSEAQIRRAMSNCSRGDASAMTLPKDLAERDWPALTYLGWRDPKLEQRGYLLRRHEGRPARSGRSWKVVVALATSTFQDLAGAARGDCGGAGVPGLPPPCVRRPECRAAAGPDRQ
ncbi:FBP domain-containing protein [Catellatospora sp. NPDC049609]|uniref:FBP domain-containing protein n=1 Tax=Catellatospora sp. NPDC049609 TaxID=3155505 RepID=UPI003420F009